jgi:photosystem II stability/assembly factor-like uncharacterized protein
MEKSMNRMILLASAIIILLSQETTSQWTQTPGPEGGEASELIATPTAVLLALEGGGMFRSTDHGMTWLPSGNGLGPLVTYYSGIAQIGTTVFVSTEAAGIYRSTDDGLSWVLASGGLLANGMYVTALVAKGNLLIAATYAGMFRSTNGGSLWTAANSGMPADTAFGALGVSGASIFAGSDDGAGVFVSIDDGTLWTRSSAGLGDEALRVTCFAANAGTVVAGTRRGAYRSTDNGAHWVLCSSGLTTFTVSTVYASGSDFVGGTYGAGAFRSTNGGVDWSAISAGLGNLNVRAFTLVGSDMLAGTYGPDVVYRSSNAGATWVSAGNDITCHGIHDLVARSGKVIAASYTRLFSTTNGGAAWSFSDSGMTNKLAYSLTLRTNDILAGTSSAGVYRSTDEGQTWIPATTGLNGNARTVWDIAADSTNTFVATSSGVFRSTNDGALWVQATSGIPDSTVLTLCAAQGMLLAGTYTAVYKSTNNGGNWTAATTGLPLPSQAESIVKAGSSLFVGMYSGVYRSTDNGGAWVKVSSGLPSGPDIRSLFVYDGPLPSGPTLFAGLKQRGVYISSDNGESWTDAGTGLLGPGLSPSSFAVDHGYLYAGTIAGSVWKRPLSQILVSVGAGTVPHVPLEFSLGRNYPNPFNPTTTIEYTIAGTGHEALGTSWVKLAVYDLLGREVAVLVNEKKAAGSYEVKWDGAYFPTGVYICRMTAGDFVESRKMLLMK